MKATRRWLQGGAALLAPLLATLDLASAAPNPIRSFSAEASARSVAQEFFRTLNAREFEKTCDLLSIRYYRDNRVPDKAQCAWRLTLGFAWTQPVRFKIVAVRVHGDGAVIRALADGVAGEIVLVRNAGAFKVLAVRSAGADGLRGNHLVAAP